MSESEQQTYPGERLGLPAEGPTSLASFGRRLGALVIDWLACVVMGRAFTADPLAPLVIFAVENLLLLSTLGSTFGMRLLGIRVIRMGHPGLVDVFRVGLRTALLCLVVPAVVWDRDGRGLHDKAIGTAVVNVR